MYPETLVAPMRKELTDVGVTELKTPEEVEAILSKKEGTVLVVINSVCGCAAGSARPGICLALKNAKILPQTLTTVFAGMENAAVAKAREYMLPYPPSSPSIALFKNGQLVHMIERMNIEGKSAETIALNLAGAFEEYCQS